MTRLAIGLVLGFIGLFGTGFGGGLDPTPTRIACESGCSAPQASAPVALSECTTCPDEG